MLTGLVTNDSTGRATALPVSNVPVSGARSGSSAGNTLASTFEGRLAWLARRWSDETVPESIHSGRGVFFGAPDRESCPDRAKLGGRDSTPDQLVGGSVLGSPRILPAFERYIERAETDSDQDGYYLRPLAAALSRMARPGSRRVARNLGARTIWAVIRARGDWQSVAINGVKTGAKKTDGTDERTSWPDEMFRDYLNGSIAALHELYEPRRIGR